MMTSDAFYLYDLFKMQYEFFKKSLTDRGLRRDKIDRYSYSSWAIKDTIDAIDSWDGMVSVGVIRGILRDQMSMYDRYYNSNPDKQMRYKHALNAVCYLYKLTEGYVYDEYQGYYEQSC